MGVVVRFAVASIPPEVLEAKAGHSVQYGRKRPDGSQSALIDLTPEDDLIDWDVLSGSISALGDRIADMVESGAISSLAVDVGLPFYVTNAMSAITIPARLCEAAGRNKIAITVTFYATSSEEMTS